jgi:hypothetical protein
VTQTTPVVTLGATAGELESANQVTGDAVLNLDTFGSFNTVVRTKFDFIEGDAGAISVGDLGVDSTGKGGGLLIVYAKTTDATNSDSTGYNRDVIAVQWDGAALSNRTVIDRGINENSLGLDSTATVFGSGGPSPSVGTIPLPAGNYIFPNPFNAGANGLGPTTHPRLGTQNSLGAPGSGLGTQLAGLLQVPSNPDITKGALSPTETYVYMTTPTGDDGNSSIGLFTRTFNHSLRAQANNAASFGDSFVPTAGTGPGSATFVQPQRMDHMTGGNVTPSGLQINHAGTEATVIFQQDGHMWLSGTADGLTQPYTNNGKGSADPFLVDNDSSASVVWSATAGYDDSACNNLHKSIFFFAKNDLSVSNHFNGAGGANNSGSNSSPSNGIVAIRLRLRTFN